MRAGSVEVPAPVRSVGSQARYLSSPLPSLRNSSSPHHGINSQSVSKPKPSHPKTFVQQPPSGSRLTSPIISPFFPSPQKNTTRFHYSRHIFFLYLYNCHCDARALGHQPLGPPLPLHCDRPPPPPPRNHVKPPKNISRLSTSPLYFHPVYRYTVS